MFSVSVIVNCARRCCMHEYARDTLHFTVCLIAHSISSLLSVLPLVYLILVVPLGLARPGHNTQGTWSYGALSA